jgi:hypothetical protein
MSIRAKTGLVFAVFLAITLLWLGMKTFSSSDDIPLGKELKLAAMYHVEIENGKGKPTISGRMFDFADRTLPRTSIAVPERDPRGAQIVYLDQTLPPATLKKVMVNVEARKIEGVEYPAYSYPQFRYNTGSVEIQTVRPVVVPRQR